MRPTLAKDVVGSFRCTGDGSPSTPPGSQIYMDTHRTHEAMRSKVACLQPHCSNQWYAQMDFKAHLRPCFITTSPGAHASCARCHHRCHHGCHGPRRGTVTRLFQSSKRPRQDTLNHGCHEGCHDREANSRPLGCETRMLPTKPLPLLALKYSSPGGHSWRHCQSKVVGLRLPS